MKLSIHSKNETEFINLELIVRLEAEGSYTNVYLSNKRKIMVTKPLGDYESILVANDFVRVHHSHMINLQHILKITKTNGFAALMTDGCSVPIAVRRKETFEKQLKHIAI